MTTVQSKHKCSAGEFEVYLICMKFKLSLKFNNKHGV